MSSLLKTNSISAATGSTVSIPSGTTLDIASGATLDVNGTLDVTGATVSGLTTGKVLQVVMGEDTTQTTIATTTYTDTGLQAVITPIASDSTIVAQWIVQAHIHPTEGWGTKLLRDSTAVYTSAHAYGVYLTTGSGERIRQSYMTTDTPGTTSATTYKVQVSSNGGYTVEFNEGGIATQLLLMEVAA